MREVSGRDQKVGKDCAIIPVAVVVALVGTQIRTKLERWVSKRSDRVQGDGIANARQLLEPPPAGALRRRHCGAREGRRGKLRSSKITPSLLPRPDRACAHASLRWLAVCQPGPPGLHPNKNRALSLAVIPVNFCPISASPDRAADHTLITEQQT